MGVFNFRSFQRNCRPHRIALMVYSFIMTIFLTGKGFSQDFEMMRENMIEKQLIKRGISDSRVIAAASAVPRQNFVPEERKIEAYQDYPIPIGHQQTISQPFIVAYMTEALELNPGDKVLEIGSGSGYQAAILAEMGAEVYTIELIPELAAMAQKNLTDSGYKNVKVKQGNGYLGWPEAAPFDRIILTAAPREIPRALVEQLKVNGIMILPVGSQHQIQSLKKIVKKKKGLKEMELTAVRFVPMVDPEK